MSFKTKYFSRYQPAAQERYEQRYPDKKADPDYHKEWWETQWKRCLLGYEPTPGDWIPGAFYFHVNFEQGDVYHPLTNDTNVEQYPYDDLSHELFMKYDDWDKRHMGGLILKGRRLHFSTTTTSLLLHRFSFYPGSRCGVGSWDDDDVKNVRNMLNVARGRLPIEMQFAAIDNPEILEASSKINTGAGDQGEGTFSRIYFRCFGGKLTKVGAFRGTTLKFHLIDEIGKNPRLLDCISASEECWSKGSLRYGIPICGGTADTMTVKTDHLQRFVNNPELWGFEKFIIPRQRFFYPFYDLKTGIASPEKQEEARLWIKAQQATLYNQPNKQPYYAKLQENPTCEQDMMMGDSANAILPLDCVNDQIRVLNDYESAKTNVRYYNLHWKNGRFDPNNPQVEWDTTATNGEYAILYMPQKKFKNLDIGGVDTYFKSGAPNSPSKGCMYIYRRFNDLDSSLFCQGPVAEYSARYPTTQQFYDGCLKLAVAYDSMILSEHDEAFKVFMENCQMLKYFKKRPTALDTEYTRSSQEYMLTMSAQVKDRITGLLQNYIPNFVQNIGFVRLLEDMKNYGVSNTDFVMAFGISLVHDLDIRNHMVIDMTQPKKHEGDFWPGYQRNPQTGIIEPTYYGGNTHKPMDMTKRF